MSSLDAKIEIVMRQTNYNEEQAREKLVSFEDDELAVIRDYMGVPSKKPTKVIDSSINQAIYKQLRGHLDKIMSEYRDRQENKDTHPQR